MNIEFEAIENIDKNIAIAISYNINAVFKVNMLSGECEYIGTVPNEKLEAKRLYVKAIKARGKIYFIPYTAKGIAVYDIEKKYIYKIELNDKIKEYQQENKNNKYFSDGVVYNKHLFIIPCMCPVILRLNTENDTIDYYDDWVRDREFVFRKDLEVDGNYIYAASCINNLVLQFDMEKCKGNLMSIGNNNGSWGICKVKNSLWISPQGEGAIIEWNKKNGQINEYNDYPYGFKGNDFLFTKIYNINDEIYVIPAHANMGVKIDCNTHKIEKFNIDALDDINVTLFMFELDKYIYLKRVGNEVNYIRINKDNNVVDKYNFYIKNNDELKMDVIYKTLNEDEIIKESKLVQLEDFIDFIKVK